MRSLVSSIPLLLFFLVYQFLPTTALCSLDKLTTAQCHDLEDARYIDTYELHVLRAPSSAKVLAPGNFKNLTSLKHLDLSGGKIETIKSNSFALLGELLTLNLAENHISNLEPSAFGGLKHLHSLKLRDNDIKQLPSALIDLKKLKLLDLTDNPLNCNCASLKLRDTLLAKGVKITKKSLCSQPSSAKHSSILKPDMKIACEFEKQDEEMQGDQPIEDLDEGSGEASVALDKEEVNLEDDGEETEESNENEESVTPSSSEATSVSTALADTLLTEASFSTTVEAKDDITFDDLKNSQKKEPTTETSVDEVIKPTESEESQGSENDNNDSENVNEHIDTTVIPKESSTTENYVNTSSESSNEKTDIVVSTEGSGESDDDGSGSEGSGMIAKMPGIDFNETSVIIDTDDGNSPPAQTTTEPLSFWGFGNMVNNFLYGDSTEAPKMTEKTPEESLKEEQFIQVTQKPAETSPPEVTQIDQDNQTPSSFDLSRNEIMRSSNDGTVDSAFSQESKKGMGSYIVLAILLAVLATLIIVAAYRGDFCRKKQKRRDVERGTELKDMQKTLLDQNTAQPKIQVSNGNTLENVPLMNSSAPPDEPKENQRSYDITPSLVTNGRSNGGPTIDDPVKPPRKNPNPEIEAPLNGLNPPMEDIDAPAKTSLRGGSNENLPNGEYDEQPPLSPNAQRVKITMQEIPESIPKTPILITRLKGGENLVKTP